MRKVRILQEAAEEAIAAADWYDKEREGLGKEFANAVEIAVTSHASPGKPSRPIQGETTAGVPR